MEADDDIMSFDELDQVLAKMSNVVKSCRKQLRSARTMKQAAEAQTLLNAERESALDAKEHAFNKKQKLLVEREEAVVQAEARWSTIIEKVNADVEASKEIVFIEARNIEFKLSKAKLLKLGNTYFKGLLTFNPVREGSRYFLDRYSNSNICFDTYFNVCILA